MNDYKTCSHLWHPKPDKQIKEPEGIGIWHAAKCINCGTLRLKRAKGPTGVSVPDSSHTDYRI